MSALTIVLASFGVVATAVGAGLEISALSQKPAFDRCGARCDLDEVSAWETKWRVADVTVGVGIASLAVATYMYVTRPAVSPSVPTASALGIAF